MAIDERNVRPMTEQELPDGKGLGLLKGLGVTRLSLGVENFDDAVLEDCPEAVADVDTPGEYEFLIGARVETRVLP